MIGYLLTFLIGASLNLVGYIKTIFISQISISPSLSPIIYQGLKYKEWNIVYDVTDQIEFPICAIKLIWFKYPFFLYAYQAELKTGWQAKEKLLQIYTFRWWARPIRDELKRIAKESQDNSRIDIKISMKGGYYLKTQSIKRNEEPLYLDKSTKDKIHKMVDEFHSGAREKLGLLLYGPPGNGKSSLVKHLAKKYGYNIHIIDTAKLTNDCFIQLFANHDPNRKKIVLFEDFDNTFDGRTPLMKTDESPTLDIILNIIDGVYVNNENTLFLMTCNDLGKIDPALKNRPSRFDSTILIDNPSDEVRQEITPYWKECAGMSVAEIQEKLLSQVAD